MVVSFLFFLQAQNKHRPKYHPIPSTQMTMTHRGLGAAQHQRTKGSEMCERKDQRTGLITVPPGEQGGASREVGPAC